MIVGEALAFHLLRDLRMPCTPGLIYRLKTVGQDIFLEMHPKSHSHQLGLVRGIDAAHLSGSGRKSTQEKVAPS